LPEVRVGDGHTLKMMPKLVKAILVL
jgi:hypothetical protein